MNGNPRFTQTAGLLNDLPDRLATLPTQREISARGLNVGKLQHRIGVFGIGARSLFLKIICTVRVIVRCGNGADGIAKIQLFPPIEQTVSI